MTVDTALPVRPYRPSRSMRLFLALAAKIQAGQLTVTLPDDTTYAFRGDRPGPRADLRVHDERLAGRFLFGGTLGFCESYLDHQWSSDDMEALFQLALVNEQVLGDILDGHKVLRAIGHVVHRLRPNSRSGSRRNIQYHYDLGNAFYERWLDPTMTYSSAIFPTTCDQPISGRQALTEGQYRKYAEIAGRANVRPGDHILEIGCGWGGFAAFAASEIGARVTGITISQEQFDYASRRIQALGLGDRVSIELKDYRETAGQYDGVVSIEMAEAVGERYWPGYFGIVRDRLRDGGTAALQVITIDQRYFSSYRRGADYIQKYIFPGGMLPSLPVLSDQVARAGMRVQDVAGFGRDYARTLREWNKRFQNAWPEIRAMGFDERFKRMWEQYFAYCAAGFEHGCIDVHQVAITRE